VFLSYGKAQGFRDIQLDNKSLLDASGFFNGNISLRGQNISLTQFSVVEASNSGPISLGKIDINASETLKVVGVRTVSKPTGDYIGPARGIFSQSFSTGKGADIIVSANQLLAQDSGGIATQTLGPGTGGSIELNIKGLTQVFSTNLPTTALTVGTISTSTSGAGSGGGLKLTTKRLTVENGGYVGTYAFNSGNAGIIRVTASDKIEILGGRQISFDPNFIINSFWPSFFGSLTTSSGRAGDVFLTTRHLLLKDGARLDSSALASGLSGNITINAIESVDVTGKASGFSDPTQIISSANIVDPFFQLIYSLPNTLNGSSGSITINTNHLAVHDGAQITVKNDGIKQAGLLKIDANSINLDNQSGITASTASGAGGNIFLNVANKLSLDHNSLITATAGGQGTGGNITIDPQQTNISNGSGIAVNSTGTGNAGQLRIFSNSLTLNNGGFLSANTNGGEGGNIVLNASNLQLRHSSLFTAAAQGSGNGGNITINTGTLAALENSPITADAYQGRGGNIQINAQGIFQSPDSPITASSKLGINGTVRINTLDVNAVRELAILPVVPVDYTKLIAQGCPANVGPRASKFVMTGNGALPPSPSDPSGDDAALEDWKVRSSSTSDRLSDSSDIENAIPSTQYNGGPLIEAQGWATNSKGELVLTASAHTYTPDVPWLKSPSCHAQ